MFEGTESSQHDEFGDERTEQPEPGHPAAGEDAGLPEKEQAGSAKEGVTERISEEGEKGQTTSPAPEEDVGVPEDPGEPKDSGS